jgi:hypothetical protein
MRLILLRVLIVALVFMFLSLAPGQQNNASDQKHVIIAPQNANRSVQMEALSIERGLPYPSVVTLKGNVSIKTPVCLPVGKQDTDVCDGYMIVRADEAEFDERTGEIRPHGNVVITPLYHEKKK